jgi:hypothetical protein
LYVRLMMKRSVSPGANFLYQDTEGSIGTNYCGAHCGVLYVE